MAKQDDFEAHVRRMQELKESGSILKNTGPLDLTKFSYKSGKSWSKTPVQNRRVIAEFAGPLKKPFDTDILVDQNLEPIKYKGLTGDIEGMSGSQAESGPVKSESKKVGQKRYIDESKIKTIMAYLSQQVEKIGKVASESRKPLTKKVEYVDRQGNLRKKDIPLRSRQIESGKGKIVLGTEGYQWVADSKGSYPTFTSMSSSGMSKTAFEMVEEAIGKAWKKAVQVGYHEFGTSELEANPITGKKFDRNIRVNPEAFKHIIQDRLIPTLFAKSDDSASSFSLTHEEYDELEKMQGQVVETKEGILLRRSDPRSIDFARKEPRGGDAIHWDETVGFRDDGYDPGKHMSGEDISDNNISRGILPGEEKKFQVADKPQEVIRAVSDDFAEATAVQKVEAASATGTNPVDENVVHQHFTEDFEFYDDDEQKLTKEKYNNPIKEEVIGNKAVYQESTKLLQEFQQGQVKQLRGVDPILSHLVLRGAQTQKAINPPVEDPGKTVVKKNLKAIRFKPSWDLPSVEVKPSETIAFPEIDEQKKLSAMRTDPSWIEREKGQAIGRTKVLDEKKVDTEARDTQYEQSKQDLKKLNVNQLAVSHLASQGLISEFVTGPEPEVNLKEWIKESPLAGKKSGIGEPVIAPETKDIVPQKTTSVTVDGKSHVLTHNVNINPGSRSTQLTLGIDGGEVPEIQEKPNYPQRGIQDQLDMRNPPTVVSGEVDTKGAFPIQQQGTLDIELEKSKTATALNQTDTFMTQQEKLRTAANQGANKVFSSGPVRSLPMFSMGLNLLTAPLQGVFAYKDAERFNYESTEPPRLVPAVTGDQWAQQFKHRMSMGAVPSIGQIQWAKQQAIQQGMIQ